MFESWSVIDVQNIKPATDPEISGVEIDETLHFVTLRWGGGAYDIDLSGIRRPEDLLWKLHHIGKKTWPGMTPKRISALIEIVGQIKGWPMYGRVRHPNEAPKPNHDKIKERDKMTHAIRYAVIKRDGYRCRACGFAVQDGAHLHVDHIIAIANGGATELSNLQTLCTSCNLGKAAS